MKTSTYTDFSFKKTNRNISRKKVEAIKENIIKFGYDENYPVLINDKFEIIDGQHRFKACQELNIDIVFNKAKHDSDEYMRSLNTVSSGWELRDYINSYANEERETYQQFLRFMDEHKINITTALIVFCQNSKATEIRDGKPLKVNLNCERVMTVLNLFSDLPFYTKKAFTIAVVSFLSKTPSQQQIDKLVKYRLALVEMANATQFLTAFENIINQHVKTNKISLR